MEYRDYYATLGVPRTASQADIRKAFRRLAREHHPDVNKGDTGAEQRFKEVSEANEVLSDPEKRKAYDQLGANWEAYQRAGAGRGANPFAGLRGCRGLAGWDPLRVPRGPRRSRGLQRLLPHVLRRQCDRWRGGGIAFARLAHPDGRRRPEPRAALRRHRGRLRGRPRLLGLRHGQRARPASRPRRRRARTRPRRRPSASRRS